MTVEYEIEPQELAQFAQVTQELGLSRKRDGAYRWGLFHDVAEPARCVETFVVESWAEHLRQHQRVTVADKAIEERAYAFHRGASPPRVAHLISAYAASLSARDELEEDGAASTLQQLETR